MTHFTHIFQITIKKTTTQTNRKATLTQPKPAADAKEKKTVAKNGPPRKPKKSVRFAAESCRRSLCFDDEETDFPNEGASVRSKREAAKVTDGFYKEKPLNSKLCQD